MQAAPPVADLALVAIEDEQLKESQAEDEQSDIEDFEKISTKQDTCIFGESTEQPLEIGWLKLCEMEHGENAIFNSLHPSQRRKLRMEGHAALVPENKKDKRV